LPKEGLRVLPVEWTEQATHDLIEIISYIELRNPSAAFDLHALLVQAAEKIPVMPYIFRPGREAGSREYVVHPNYILVYEVKSNSIDIVRVLHAKQEYPKS
jgi:toxin ParE1/3/4